MTMIPLLAAAAAVNAATFWDAIRAHDSAAAAQMVDQDAALASSKSPKGTSAVTAALFWQRGEGFVAPPDNVLLVAILRRHPPLSAHEACAVGTAAEVKALLDADAAFVKSRNAFGWTPLHLAAFAGNLEVARLLLDRGADIDARAESEFKNSPLQAALLTAQVEMARLLVARGADVNQRQEKGFTALHEAAQTGSAALVQLLLAAGANKEAKAEDGRTPLDFAVRGKHAEAAELLGAR